MNVEFINPFVKATTKVFRTMLGCELTRQQLLRKKGRQPFHDVSGLIELYGRASGIVVLGVSREIALKATEVMLQERQDSVNEFVLDALGELTNIIAGNAKADFERLELRVRMPHVLVGRNHLLPLDECGPAIDILFGSEWGTVVVEVSLLEHCPAVATA